MDTRGLSRRGRAWLTAQPPLLYLVVALGTVLRLYGLGAESFWVDEVASLRYITGRTVVEVITEVPYIDRHPPLYYALLRGWIDLVGTSERAVRLLSAVFGIATIPALYGVGARLFDRRVGVVSAGLLAISRFHVLHSQSARMYSLLTFGAVCSMYFLVRLHTRSTWSLWAGYVGATVVTLTAHAFGVFVVAAQAVYLGLRVRLSDDRMAMSLRRWLGAQVVAGLVAAPLGIGLVLQAVTLSEGGDVNVGWIPEPTVMRVLTTVGSYLTPETAAIGLVTVGLSGTLLAIDGSRRSPDRERSALVTLWFLLPIVGPLVLSYLLAPLFVARYTIAAVPALFLGLAATVRRTASVEIRYITLALLVVALLSGLPGYYGQTAHPEWRDATGVIEGNASEDAVVLASERGVSNPVEFYLPEQGPTTVGVNESVTTARLNRTVEDRDQVWLVLSRVSERNRSRLTGRLTAAGYSRGPTHSFHAVTVVQFTANGSRS